jgi:DNA-binding CsgD family transcriptional regulator
MINQNNRKRIKDNTLNFDENYPDYDSFESYIEPLRAYLKLSDEIVYIRDLYKNNYPFISKSPTFYTGYTIEELTLMGDDILKTLIAEEDLIFLSEFEPLFFSFVKNLEPQRREYLVVNIAQRFKHKNNTIFPATFEVTPFLFDSKFNIWMLLGKVTLATKNFGLGAFIKMKDTNKKYVYDSKNKKLVLEERVSLTNKEKHILAYSARGYLEKEIAEDLNVSINTIKTHKKNIMKKLSANNMSEAFISATNQKLL